MCWPYGIVSQVDLQMNCTVQKFPTHWIEFYLNVSVIFAENFSASWWLYSSCSYFPPRTCCNSLKFTVRTIIRGRRVCCSLGKRTRLRGACVCDWMSVCSRGPGRLLGDVHRPHAVLGSPLFTFFEEFEQNANWSISNLKLWNFLNGKQSKFRVFGWIIKCWQPLWRWLSILFLKIKNSVFFSLKSAFVVEHADRKREIVFFFSFAAILRPALVSTVRLFLGTWREMATKSTNIFLKNKNRLNSNENI